MESAFNEGVENGGLRDSYQINLLVSYLLRSIPEPLTFEELQFACLKDGLINYFELSNSLEELIHLGQVEEIVNKDSETSYQISEKSKNRIDLLIRELPRSVRDRALENIMQLLNQKRQSSTIETFFKKKEDGFQVQLNLPDLGTDLLNLSLFVPDEESAVKIEESFKNNADKLYKSIWAILTNDRTTLLNLIEKNEKLKK